MHVSNLYGSPQGEAAGAAAGRPDLCRYGVLHQFGRRSGRMRDQDRARLSPARRQRSQVRAHHLQERLPRADAWRRSARRTRRRCTRASCRCCRASNMSISTISKARKAAIGPNTAGLPGRADPGRRRHPRRPRTHSCRACARWPTSTTCCWCSTKSSAAWRAPARSMPMSSTAIDARHHGDRQGHRRRLPDRRLPRHRKGRARDGASARTARPMAATRWRWRRAKRCSMRSRTTNSSPKSRAKGERLRGRLEQFIGNYPELFELVRGTGLMLGRQDEDRSRARSWRTCATITSCSTVAAGDNTVRLVPPLVIDDSHIDEFMDKLSAGAASYRAGGGRMTRHFLDLSDAGGDAIAAMLNDAIDRKAARAGWPKGKPDADAPLAGHVLAMIFEKNSTRTRVSFDMAMRQLGGSAIVMDAGTMQLGRGETIADTARVLSRMVDAIMIRTDDHAKIEELAHYATVPVINGLTDRSHPCQIMADLLTMIERGKALPGLEAGLAGRWQQCAQFDDRGGGADEVQRPRRRCRQGYEPDRRLHRAAHARRARSHADPRCRRGGRAARMWSSPIPGSRWARRTRTTSSRRWQPYQVDEALMAAASAGRGVPALPARASRRGSDRRGDRRAAVGGLGRGGKPHPRPEIGAALGVRPVVSAAVTRVRHSGRRDRL